MQSGASANDYGARASRDLGVTKGAGFRKEKNKKKRGVRDFRVECVFWGRSDGSRVMQVERSPCRVIVSNLMIEIQSELNATPLPTWS